MESAYSLVLDSAKRGDNVGLDEYPTLDHFRSFVSRSDAAVFLTTADPEDRVDALIVVSPCDYARSPQPILCSVLIVAAAQQSEDLPGGAWPTFISVAMEMARRVRAGRYCACVADVFVTCLERLEAFRRAGFLITACIPHAGKLAGFGAGYVANYILYKEVQDNVCPKSASIEICRLVVFTIIFVKWLLFHRLYGRMITIGLAGG